MTLPRLRPRRLLGHPPVRPGLAVLPLAAARRARRRDGRVAARVAHPLDDGQGVSWSVRSTRRRPGSARTRTATGSGGAASSTTGGGGGGGGPSSVEAVLGPLVRVAAPSARARALRAARALRSADGLAAQRFLPTRNGRARSSPGARPTRCCRSSETATAAFGLVLACSGHLVGWPCPRGGAQAITDATGAYLRTLGGEIESRRARRVRSASCPPPRAVLCDVTPRSFAARRRPLVRGLPRPAARLPLRAGRVQARLRPRRADSVERARRRRARPFTSAARSTTSPRPRKRRGAEPSRAALRPPRQHSLFDDTRAPAGKHTVWAYCHFPNGSFARHDRPHRGQIERFAPGFRDRVLERSVLSAEGARAPQREPRRRRHQRRRGRTCAQLLLRPIAQRVPYATPLEGVYLCSSSTPPGGGVHGMCGYLARARRSERRLVGALLRLVLLERLVGVDVAERGMLRRDLLPARRAHAEPLADHGEASDRAFMAPMPGGRAGAAPGRRRPRPPSRRARRRRRSPPR